MSLIIEATARFSSSLPLTGCSWVCGLHPPPGRPTWWSPEWLGRWWSARRTSAARGTWWECLSARRTKETLTTNILHWPAGLLMVQNDKMEWDKGPCLPLCAMTVATFENLLTHLHAKHLPAWLHGAVLEGELVLPDDGPAVLVPGVSHHVEIWSPHLKFPLPVDDGGEGGAHQERPLGVTLTNTRRHRLLLILSLPGATHIQSSSRQLLFFWNDFFKPLLKILSLFFCLFY